MIVIFCRENCFMLRSRECDIFLWCCERHRCSQRSVHTGRPCIFYSGRWRNVSIEGIMKYALELFTPSLLYKILLLLKLKVRKLYFPFLTLIKSLFQRTTFSLNISLTDFFRWKESTRYKNVVRIHIRFKTCKQVGFIRILVSRSVHHIPEKSKNLAIKCTESSATW